MTNSVHFVAQWIRIMAARHSLNLLTTSTALVALLAACGGGGGSQRDKIVSSSPRAPPAGGAGGGAAAPPRAPAPRPRAAPHPTRYHASPKRHAPHQPAKYAHQRGTQHIPTGPGRTPQPDGNESTTGLTCPTAERNPARHPTHTNARTIPCHHTQRLRQGRAR